MSGSRHRILVVDDSAHAREALAGLLAYEGYDVVTAPDGTAALLELDARPPDLVITDLEMPSLGGFDFIRALRQRSSSSDIPTIIVSAHHDTAYRVTGFSIGADDFVPKPLDFAELMARIHRHLYRASRQREAVRQSVSDELTGMLNRRGITNFFERALRGCRERKEPISILLCDVDKFKTINDRFGHAAGDLALTQVARALQNVVRATDRVGRIGGDEFLIVMPGADASIIHDVRSRLRSQLPIELALSDADRASVTLSLGAASAHPGDSLEGLIERADLMMYEHKREQSRARGVA